MKRLGYLFIGLGIMGFAVASAHAQSIPSACQNHYKLLGECLTKYNGKSGKPYSTCPNTTESLNNCLSLHGSDYKFDREKYRSPSSSFRAAIISSDHLKSSGNNDNKSSEGYTFNLGWGYEVERAKNGELFSGRDAHTLANQSPFRNRNKCDRTRKEYPCSPILGLQSDGSLLCSSSMNSSQACLDESKEKDGIKNLKTQVDSCEKSSTCDHDYLKEKLKEQGGLLSQGCAGSSSDLCKGLMAKVREAGVSMDIDQIEEVTKAHLAKEGNKERNVPPGGDNCKELEDQMKQRAGGEVTVDPNQDVSKLPVVQNASPSWKKIISAFAKKCDGVSEASMYRKFGACSSSDFGSELRSTEHLDLLNKGATYSPDKLNEELGNYVRGQDKPFPLSRLQTVFCNAKDSEDALKRARNNFGVTHPQAKEGVVGNLGGPSWLHNCLKKTISLQQKGKLSDGIIKGTGTVEHVLQSNVDTALENYEHKADNCEKKPFTEIALDQELLKEANHGRLILYQKAGNPGARCMVLESYESYSKHDLSQTVTYDNTTVHPREQGYRAKLSLPAGSDPNDFGQTYNYDVTNAKELLDRFEGARFWHCKQNKDVKGSKAHPWSSQ